MGKQQPVDLPTELFSHFSLSLFLFFFGEKRWLRVSMSKTSSQIASQAASSGENCLISPDKQRMSVCERGWVKADL